MGPPQALPLSHSSGAVWLSALLTAMRFLAIKRVTSNNSKSLLNIGFQVIYYNSTDDTISQ